ncbi:MAG: hypothetical protein KCHDKBKB_01300 [Elusimicrobia bacterium]|nr:hypothetical protein [Elusimicrobiota bacterium]
MRNCKSRDKYAASLIILMAAVSFSGEKISKSYEATISHACAPWDGAAFSITIPTAKVGGKSKEAEIRISIWKEPKIVSPVSFTFPDNTSNVGAVGFFPLHGSPIPLNGTVSFQKVETSSSVQGEFNLTSEKGDRYEGEFKATWSDFLPECG